MKSWRPHPHRPTVLFDCTCTRVLRAGAPEVRRLNPSCREHGPRRSKLEHGLDLLALIAAVAIVLLVAIGCAPPVDDDAPELDGCPGGLLCECFVEAECDDDDQGIAHSTCGPDGFCTTACSELDPCDLVLPDVVCGPRLVGVVPVCGLVCDELAPGDDCAPLGLPGAACGPDLLCAYGSTEN